MEPLEYRSLEAPRSHSRAGIASLILGLLCLIGLFLSLRVQVRSPTVQAGSTSSQTSSDPSPAVAMAIALTCLACPVLGAILGIVGVRSKERKRISAVLGLCLNGAVLLVLAGAVVLSLFLMR